jgi:Glycine zipper
MKNLLLITLLITGFAACNSPADDFSKRDIRFLNDSTAFVNNASSDTAVAVATKPVAAKVIAQPRQSIITKKPVRINAPTTVTAPVATAPAAVPPVATAPIENKPDNTTVSNAPAGGTATSGSTSSTPVPQVEKKKGWSKAAQGAAIGGVTGAVGGAILSKKKGVGAVVGGVVGAAGGYILGKGMDKKDNRLVIK